MLEKGRTVLHAGGPETGAVFEAARFIEMNTLRCEKLDLPLSLSACCVLLRSGPFAVEAAEGQVRCDDAVAGDCRSEGIVAKRTAN